jgi:hypothetical protein
MHLPYALRHKLHEKIMAKKVLLWRQYQKALTEEQS